MDDLYIDGQPWVGLSSQEIGDHYVYDTFIVWEGFAYGWWDFEREKEIVLWQLEMWCLKSSPNQLFLHIIYLGWDIKKNTSVRAQQEASAG